MRPPLFIASMLIITGLSACDKSGIKEQELLSSKPYARYWWFASEMKKEDIRYNLNWLKEHGFGGVELAWVYPLNSRRDYNSDLYTPRQEWLSPRWQDMVDFTLRYADSLGLGCDLTLGTLWPFGDSQVPYERASQRYGEKERQIITRSWEYPDTGYVIDHIHPDHYLPYFNRLLDSIPRPALQLPQAYFIDSWEVETDKLWTSGLDEVFEQRYGYDIEPFMDRLYEQGNKAVLYDYRKLISEKVIRFYSDFDSALNARGILSRGQCSGAPCDIISAYARLDIPEGEAMLYEPEFNSIPASSALLTGTRTVSSETFTCLYGWPGHHMREEQTADLKLVADALFANGINRIIWHGKAHNPAGQDSVSFYATVHLGKDGALAEELSAFNAYLSRVSNYMSRGSTYSDVAVYLPTEDAWIKGIMPKEKQFIWARDYYEMRYVYFPEELAGHHPIWINGEFLAEALWDQGQLRVGEASFSALYVDARYLDFSVLKRILELALEGLPLTLKQIPREAGTDQHEEWDQMIESLVRLPNVESEFIPHQPPLLRSEQPLSYWARERGQSLYLFIAHPQSRKLKFPLEYGQSYSPEILEIPVILYFRDRVYRTELKFPPHQSVLLEIRDGRMEQVDIFLRTKTPEVKKRPADFQSPWLVN